MISDLDRDYSPSSRVADITVYLDEYARRSRRARAFGHHCLRYGRRPEQMLDLFPAARATAPVMVYIHGGYWQELSKDDSSFAAPDLLREGMGFAALGYGLAPRYPLDEIVTMVREGLWWLASWAAGAVHLSGSSAGAHLVAMALLDGWLPQGLHPADVFASATLLSGIYDLDPLRSTYVNDALGLDAAAAARNSPIRSLPSTLPPLVVAVGDNETDAFTRQHDNFVAAVRPRATALSAFVTRGRNHFDLPLDLGVRSTQLGSAVLAAMTSRHQTPDTANAGAAATRNAQEGAG